jgi:hypothetical protein
MGPVAPVGPEGPVAPVGPVDPVEPVAPVAPVDPVGPVGPLGPAVPTILINSCPGWLVAVFSFESRSRLVVPVPVISRPKFVDGFEIQFCTWLVTFTSTNVFAVLTAAEVKALPAFEGCMFQVAVFSFHDEVTSVKFRVPPVVTVLA